MSCAVSKDISAAYAMQRRTVPPWADLRRCYVLHIASNIVPSNMYITLSSPIQPFPSNPNLSARASELQCLPPNHQHDGRLHSLPLPGQLSPLLALPPRQRLPPRGLRRPDPDLPLPRLPLPLPRLHPQLRYGPMPRGPRLRGASPVKKRRGEQDILCAVSARQCTWDHRVCIGFVCCAAACSGSLRGKWSQGGACCGWVYGVAGCDCRA